MEETKWGVGEEICSVASGYPEYCLGRILSQGKEWYRLLTEKGEYSAGFLENSDMRQSLYANTLLLEILFWRNAIPVKIPLRKDEKGRHFSSGPC